MHYKKISLSQNLGEYVVWKIRRKMGLRFEWNQIIYAILSNFFKFAHINGTPICGDLRDENCKNIRF